MAPVDAVGRVVIVSPPIPWRDVPAGAQVLIDGVPQTFLFTRPTVMGAHIPEWLYADLIDIYVEGCTPPRCTVREIDTVQIVIMDGADAVANLLAAGFTATPIEE